MAYYRHNNKWHKFLEPFIFEDKLSICDKSQPFLGTFDECVNFCKQFKSIEDVEAYHQKVLTKWQEDFDKIKEKEKKKQNLSWSSENDV